MVDLALLLFCFVLFLFLVFLGFECVLFMCFSDLRSVLRLSAEFFYFFYLYCFCLQLHLLFATVAAAEVYPSSSGKQAIKQAARISGNDSGDQQEQRRDRVSKIREKQTASEFLFRARFWRETTHCTSCEGGGDRRSLRACLFVRLFVCRHGKLGSLPAKLFTAFPASSQNRRK